MILQVTPYAAALILTGSVTLLLAGYAAQRRSTQGWVYFILTMLAVSWWSLSYALELTAQAISLKLFWSTASYAGALSLPPLWFLFAVHYHKQSRQLPSRIQAGVFVFPAVVMALAISNGIHGWVWSEVSLIPSQSDELLYFTYGPVFWVNTVYAYSLMLSGSVLLAWGGLRSPRIFRTQTLLLIGAAMFPWLSNIVSITGINPFPGLDLTPPTFAISGIWITQALFRYRLLDLKPVAYDLFFACMENEALVLDAQGRLLEANPAARRLFNIQDSQIGQPLTFWLQASPQFVCLFQEKGDESCEVAFQSGDAMTWRSVQSAPLSNDQGEPCGKLVVLNDITHRKLAEEQLNLAHQQALEASRLKTRLLASVSHDLRTPMTAILGFAELIRSGVLGKVNDQQRTALENIQESANQQLAFVNNLIGQAQLETGRIVLNVQHFPLNDLIEPVQTNTEIAALRKGLTLNFIPALDLPDLLYGDPYWLRQVLLNLVNNAIKFTQRGEVTVRVFQSSSKTWAIEVSDTGIGIPQEKLDEIFEPFRQLKENCAGQSGSGLGLSIVRQLVDLMYGEVQVESRLGEGSTFTVTLPYTPSTAQVPLAFQERIAAQ